MRKILLGVLLVLAMVANAQNEIDSTRTKVLMQTTMGDVVIALYNETPLHRDNFLKHVKNGDYDGMLFHRVINKFMVQTGDPLTRPPQQKTKKVSVPLTATIPAEILYPQFFHKKGAVAAAREGDDKNPQRASSSSQFYIVMGNRRTEWELDNFQKRIDEATNGEVVLTPEVREVYKEIGGSPHLDGQYTVFGEVVSGLEVVDAIQKVDVDDMAKPLEDIRVTKVRVLK